MLSHQSHNHSLCTVLAGELDGYTSPQPGKPYQNILIYARKSDFVAEMMQQIQ
jgi:hypothetical protein